MTGSHNHATSTPGRKCVLPSNTRGKNRMPELGPSGSARGAVSNHRSYRDHCGSASCPRQTPQSGHAGLTRRGVRERPGVGCFRLTYISAAVAADSTDQSKACVPMPSEVTTVSSEQLVEELRRQLAEALETQTATAAILRVIASSPGDLTPVLSAVAESAARLCDAFDALVMLRKGDELHTLAHHGPIPARPGGPIARDWVNGRAFLDRTPVQVADLTTAGADFPRGQAMAVRDGFRTSLAIPLQRQKGEPVGAICVRRTEVRPVTEKQIGLLQTFADQAVIAIENTRLFEAEQASKRELQESLEYQTATSGILDIISRSKAEI